jgi:hypothetical protein
MIPTDGFVAMTFEDILDEAKRLVTSARHAGLEVRLFGGVAVRLASGPQSARRELERPYHDIDLVAPRRMGRRVAEFMAGEGYEPNARFNAIHGETRLMFHDPHFDRPIDVFAGRIEMCHHLELEPRLGILDDTLAGSDLLLSKLQIVRLNRKDVVDALALLLQFEPGQDETRASLDCGYIAGLCCADWGWHTTLSDNLDHVGRLAPEILKDDNDIRCVQGRIEVLLSAIDEAPKSRRWRMRSRIGRRIPWYDLPEEVTTALQGGEE